MTHKEVIDYCLQKPGAYLDYPFGPEVSVVKVKSYSQEKGRIFAQAFFLRGEPKITLSCTPDMAILYRNIYLGSVVRGWHCPPVMQPYFNTVNLDGTVPDKEIFIMIDQAYETVLAKFPKYIQKEISELKI